MIALKLYRDEARELRDHFFPYLILVCENKMGDGVDRQSEMTTPEDKWDAITEMLIGRMMWSLIDSVKIKLDKKLLTVQNSFSIKMIDAEAICFYQLLMNMPIEPRWVYAINLRRKITDYLSKELGI